MTVPWCVAYVTLQAELLYWKEAVDEHGRKYWWNELTREAQWEKPYR